MGGDGVALRDNPYLPLYVQDFLTDEKLCECSAEATGVYIRLMCILHKSDTYGKILLQQKYKQNGSKSTSKFENFASKLSRQMPYDAELIARALEELCAENVICIEEDCLYQKRMVKDSELSEKRAKSGSKGGSVNKAPVLPEQNTKQNGSKSTSKTPSKTEANSENEIENEIEERKEKDRVVGEEKETRDTFSEFAGGDDKLLLALNDFEAMRKKIRKPLTDRAKEMLVRKLEKEFKPKEWIDVLEQSIAFCWQGIFPLKQQDGQNQSHSAMPDYSGDPNDIDLLFGGGESN